MIEVILCVFILAKIKHYKISVFFTKPVFYPILICEVIHLIFQISVFSGVYIFVPYASILKRIYMYTMLIPLFVYKQYRPAITGSAFVFAGTLLNNFVMAQNGGKMPVFPTLSYLTGYVKPDTFALVQDIHVLGTTQMPYFFLSDIFDLGYTILSFGDLLIRMFVFITIYCTIKHLQQPGITKERRIQHAEN